MSKLISSLYKISSLQESDKSDMWELFHIYYDGSDRRVFFDDLSKKNYALLLKNNSGEIKGFSTIEVYQEEYEDETCSIIYSGDTIIDQAYWGKNDFAKDWLRFAGYIKSQKPELPLYWLLIVKGHRTYRYLSLYSNEYYPKHHILTPHNFQNLMDYLSEKKFGSCYDPGTGIVKFPEPRSFMRNSIAHIPEKDMIRPEVVFFLKKNPRFLQGEELVCLCKLDPENLTPLARKLFLGNESYSHVTL